MSLQCDFDCEAEPGDVFWCAPREMTTLQTKRGRKCCSCGKRIDVGASCLHFERMKVSESEIEERIHGEEVPQAPWFMCADCGMLYLFLAKFDYAIQITDSMHDLALEHAELAKQGQAGCL